MNDKKRPYTALLIGGLTFAILTVALGAAELQAPMIVVCAMIAVLWIEDLE